jgi:hypothetical protein
MTSTFVGRWSIITPNRVRRLGLKYSKLGGVKRRRIQREILKLGTQQALHTATGELRLPHRCRRRSN